MLKNKNLTNWNTSDLLLNNEKKCKAYFSDIFSQKEQKSIYFVKICFFIAFTFLFAFVFLLVRKRSRNFREAWGISRGNKIKADAILTQHIPKIIQKNQVRLFSVWSPVWPGTCIFIPRILPVKDVRNHTLRCSLLTN